MKYERLTKWEEKGIASVNGGSPIDKDFAEAINRLADLEDKIEAGTLVELPCKVGDTVYCVESRKNVRPYEKLVLGLEYYCDEERHYWQIWACDGIYELGEDIFLTKAEAEKRLQELRGGE